PGPSLFALVILVLINASVAGHQRSMVVASRSSSPGLPSSMRVFHIHAKRRGRAPLASRPRQVSSMPSTWTGPVGRVPQQLDTPPATMRGHRAASAVARAQVDHRAPVSFTSYAASPPAEPADASSPINLEDPASSASAGPDSSTGAGTPATSKPNRSISAAAVRPSTANMSAGV